MDELEFANMFSDVTEEQEVKNKKITESIQEETNKIGEIARSCLNNPDFQYYKEHYMEIERKIMREMANYRHVDIARYGMQMMIFTEKLRTIRYLLDKVQKDSRKGEK